MARLLPGCLGYQLGPVKPKIYKDIKKIAVLTFKNRTLEPRLELLVTNSVIKQFQQDGTYQIVREKEADAVITGDIERLVRNPESRVSGNVLLAREYVVVIQARYQMTISKSGQLIDNRRVTGDTTFFTSGTTIQEADVNQDERQALPLAAENLAVKLVSLVAEGW